MLPGRELDQWIYDNVIDQDKRSVAFDFPRLAESIKTMVPLPYSTNDIVVFDVFHNSKLGFIPNSQESSAAGTVCSFFLPDGRIIRTESISFAYAVCEGIRKSVLALQLDKQNLLRK